MRKWILLLLLGLLLPTFASAQLKRFELTPAVGYRWLGDFDVDDVAIFDNNLEVDEGEAFGVFLDLPLTTWMQLELLASRQESQLIADQGLFTGDTVIADVDIDYYQIGLLWHWGSAQVEPFFSATLGIARLSVDLPGIVDEDRPAVTAGGGVKFFFSDHAGLRVEGRGYYVALEENDDDRWENESSLVQADVSVGFIFAW